MREINAGLPTSVCHFPVQHGRTPILSSAGARSKTAQIDTGAGVSVADTGFAPEHPQLSVPLPLAVVLDALGNRAELLRAQMAGCVIGGRHPTASLAIIVSIRESQRPLEPVVDVLLDVPVTAPADWIIDLRRE